MDGAVAAVSENSRSSLKTQAKINCETCTHKMKWIGIGWWTNCYRTSPGSELYYTQDIETDVNPFHNNKPCFWTCSKGAPGAVLMWCFIYALPKFHNISWERVYFYFLYLISLFVLFFVFLPEGFATASQKQQVSVTFVYPFLSSLYPSLSTTHPLSGESTIFSMEKNNHTKLRYILFIKASLPERTWGWEALWDHKHAFHVLSESYEDASVVLRVWSVDSLCERGGWGLLK